MRPRPNLGLSRIEAFGEGRLAILVTLILICAAMIIASLYARDLPGEGAVSLGLCF